MQEIAIIGGGRWGRALFSALSLSNRCVIASRRDLGLSAQVELSVALQCPYLVLAISTQHLRGWLERSFVCGDQKILVAAKGIETGSGAFLNTLLESVLPKENLAYLAGPSFAAEVEKRLPTALVVLSYDLSLAQKFASLFPPFIKTYADSDVIGGEICGAYKNVIAIAAGICEGMALGNNAKAALVSRGLVEMERFGRFFGAKPETFLGLAGAGDLFLTCNSPLSRNYRVGLGLAAGKKTQAIQEELGEVAEGIPTAEALLTLSQKHAIHTPIAREVQLVLQGKNPKESIRDLLESR